MVAVVDLDGGPPHSAQVAKLYSEIPRRRTYRKRFQAKPVPESVLVELAGAAEQEEAWLKVLSDEGVRQRAAELIAEGDAIQWDDRSWRRELAAWMHPRRKGDGLTVPGFVAPIAQAVCSDVRYGKWSWRKGQPTCRRIAGFGRPRYARGQSSRLAQSRPSVRKNSTVSMRGRPSSLLFKSTNPNCVIETQATRRHRGDWFSPDPAPDWISCRGASTRPSTSPGSGYRKVASAATSGRSPATRLLNLP